MPTSLGEKLKQAREAKGLQLRDVADQTRITVNYLEAIEADYYKPLPGGIFNKGFIRSFAKAVGVDEKEALADYSNLMMEQGETAEEETPLNQKRMEYVSNEREPSPLPRILIALVVLGLVAVGVYYGIQYGQSYIASLPAAATPTPSPQNAANKAAETIPTPPVVSVAEGLKVQLKANTQSVNVESTVDGKKQSFDIKAGETKDLTAQQSIKIRYSKYLAAEVQMTLNGAPATLPAAPSNPRMNGIEFEITKENYQQYIK